MTRFSVSDREAVRDSLNLYEAQLFLNSLRLYAVEARRALHHVDTCFDRLLKEGCPEERLFPAKTPVRK